MAVAVYLCLASQQRRYRVVFHHLLSFESHCWFISLLLITKNEGSSDAEQLVESFLLGLIFLLFLWCSLWRRRTRLGWLTLRVVVRRVCSEEVSKISFLCRIISSWYWLLLLGVTHWIHWVSIMLRLLGLISIVTPEKV